MSRGWIGLVLVVGGALWWFARERDARGTPESGRDATALQTTSPDEGPGFAPARVGETGEREAAGGEDAADPAEYRRPPTPLAPGPGQALLRVRAVAFEGGAPLGGVSLGLSALVAEENWKVWRSSIQSDPARGLEADTLHTQQDGRAEFLVETGFEYVLHGRGPDGVAAPAKLELGSFSPGETREVTLALRTRWTRSWVGSVLDAADDRPIVGARVRAGYSALDPLTDLVGIAEGRSDAAGRVRLLLPEFDAPLVVVESPGYATGGVRVASSSEEEPQEILLSRHAALTVRVLTEAGAPLDDVELRVRQPRWQRFEGASGQDFVWSRPSDDQGLATLEELPSGKRLWITLVQNEQVIAHQFEGEEALELDPGEQRRIEWRLPAPAAVRGTLRNSSGEPLAGVELVLTQSEHPLQIHPELREHWIPRRLVSFLPVLARTSTDASGAFALRDLPPGCFELGPAEGDRSLPQVAFPLLLEAGETENLELVLDRDLWISGVVLDPDGRPASLAEVSAANEQRAFRPVGASYLSDEDGAFRLGPLVSGAYRVTARGEEDPFLAESLPLTVTSGTEDVVLTLRRGGALTFSFRGVPETLAPEVLVRREVPGSEFLEDPAHLVPGTYSIYAWTRTGLAAFVTGFAVAAGRENVVELALQPGARVSFPEIESEDGPDHFRYTLDGMPLPEWYCLLPECEDGLWCPPGRLLIECFAWRDDGTSELVATCEREVASGQDWVVDLE